MEQNNDYVSLFPAEVTAEHCVIFDFDGTIAAKANGDIPGKAETDSNNFVLYHGVEEVLRDIMNRGIQIVIISNQSNFTEAKEQMFVNLFKYFDEKFIILVAHKKNKYRKPNIGFISLLSRFQILFYCGDAIGETATFPPFNYESTDLDFAKNANLEFLDPLEAFGSNYNTIVPKERVVIMMGTPGSGKTTLARRLENHGFTRYSQDEHKNKLDKVGLKKDMKRVLNEGGSIVLDATHSSETAKQVWIDLANSCNVDYIILWCVRCGRPFNKLRSNPVPPVAYVPYTKNFIRPSENYIIVS